MTRCQVNVGHVYPKQLTGCMWCDLVRAGGRDFFHTVPLARTPVPATQSPTQGIPDLSALWAEIERVGPKSLPSYIRLPKPARTPAKLPVAVLAAHQRANVSLWSWFRRVFDPTYGDLQTLPEYKSEAVRRQIDARQALTALEQAEKARQAKESACRADLEGRVTELRRTSDELAGSDKVRAAELAKLNQKVQADLLYSHLGRQFLRRAKLKGIGPGLLATLRSYGIETAADVSLNNLKTVPGFGTVRTSTMMTWRTGCERKFRAPPRVTIPPAELAALDQQHLNRVQRLVIALQNGLNELKQTATLAGQDLLERDRRIAGLLRAYAQAEADFRATPL